jgi:ABC-type lipoprotein export system ATPase subunit
VIATHERDITRLVDRKVEVADGSLASLMAPTPAEVPEARR